MAIANPLLDVSMSGAKGVLFNITGGTDLTLSEINEAAEIISSAADPEANIIFGAVMDDRIDDEIRITVIATGFDGRVAPKAHERTLERALERPRPAPSAPRVAPEPAPRPSYSRDDYDVPAFLRRRQGQQ